jgi:hypothetical protein
MGLHIWKPNYSKGVYSSHCKSCSLFQSLCLFRIDCKPSMLISHTYAFKIKFDSSSSMVTIGNFAILLRTYYNCTIFTCCIFGQI